MESQILKIQLQNIRNNLTTMAGNIDNTLLVYNEMTRTGNTRRNLTNLFQDLRNIYPTNSTTVPTSTTVPNSTTLPTSTTVPTSTTISQLPYSELIEVAFFNQPVTNNQIGTNNNLEDIHVYPSLRTLRESSFIHNYEDLETDQNTCTICQDNFEYNNIVRKLNCGHIFHIGCIDVWFETNIRCPLCRGDLREQNEILE